MEGDAEVTTILAQLLFFNNAGKVESLLQCALFS